MQVASSRPATTECYRPPGRNILGLPVPHQSERSFSAAARARSRVGPGSRPSWRAYTCEKPWFIARWHSPISWTVLCFGLNPEMKHRFSRALVIDNSPSDASSALSLQASIVGHIVDKFDRAVWFWRHPVRAIETRRESTHSPPDSYESMHELARHTIHSSEMLRTAIVVVESLLEESGPRSPSSDSITVTKAQRDFKFHLSRLRSLLHRSQALEARLQNEINLVCPRLSVHKVQGWRLTELIVFPCQYTARQCDREPHRRSSTARCSSGYFALAEDCSKVVPFR